MLKVSPGTTYLQVRKDDEMEWASAFIKGFLNDKNESLFWTTLITLIFHHLVCLQENNNLEQAQTHELIIIIIVRT